MYIISWEHGEKELVVANSGMVYSMSSIFEKAETPFTVSNRMGKMKSPDFGWGEFKFWVQTWGE